MINPTSEVVVKLIGTILYVGFEFWLGKTNTVKANSFLDLLIQTLTALKKTNPPEKP